MSIKDIREKLDKKKIGAVELCREYLKRIKKYDREINSFITVPEEFAIKSAKEAQKRIDEGTSDILTGIPLSVKDNIITKGIKTTCASKMLADFVPRYNATVTEKLINENAVIIGKTNMDEFGMGNSTELSYFGACKNPHNRDYSAGGSSGGAAASVAAEFCVAALGTDTGGSVRLPSAFCGVTGLKPTYSRVSRSGLVAFASSLDTIGVIASSAEDAGIVLNSISGYDKNDMTSKKGLTDLTSEIGKSLKGLRIGMPKEFFFGDIDDEVKKSVTSAAEYYKSIGCQLVDVSLPSLKYAVAAYYLISSAEASANLARYDGIKYGFALKNEKSYDELIKKTRQSGFGDEVKRRIMLGNYALSSRYYDEYYKNALRIRDRIISEYDEIFNTCDVILTPTSPVAYKKLGEKRMPRENYMADICTVPVNIAGLPAINTACGYSKNGLPIGMSIVGKSFDERKIISVADRFERDFKRRAVIL